jgi:hypothetical protein
MVHNWLEKLKTRTVKSLLYYNKYRVHAHAPFHRNTLSFSNMARTKIAAARFTEMVAPRDVVAQVKTKMASESTKRANNANTGSKRKALPATATATAPLALSLSRSAEPALSELHEALFNALTICGTGGKKLEALLVAHYAHLYGATMVALRVGSFNAHVKSNVASLKRTRIEYVVKRAPDTNTTESITLFAVVNDERVVRYEYFPDSGTAQRTPVAQHSLLSRTMYCALFCSRDEQSRYFNALAGTQPPMERFGQALLTYDAEAHKVHLYTLTRECC